MTAISTENPVLQKNLLALALTDPALMKQLACVPAEDRLTLINTRSGHMTATFDCSDGGRCTLASKYDPPAEANRLVDSIQLEGAYCFVVGGMGLGFHVKALCDRLQGDYLVIVSESSLNILATALEVVDLSEPLACGRIMFLTDANKTNLHNRLAPHNTLVMLGARFVSHGPSDRLAGSFHQQIRAMITDYVSFSKTSMITLVSNARVTCKNIAMNLPTTVATPPINMLKERFSGHPGIVISAGPSLSKNIDLLAEAKGKAVLASVQTMFKPLLRRGIEPDFVTSLDFHTISKQYFEGAKGGKDVHLVAEPKASWPVIDAFPGHVSILGNAYAQSLIGEDFEDRDLLTPGATVAHLAFYLLDYMGCNPIIFVGQDLGFTGHVFYTPGVDIHHTWQGEINRFNTMESKEWERVARNRSILRKVEDVHGKEMYTDDLLFTYLEQFEKDFGVSKARVIDATEGGARMCGSEVMTLRDALDQFAGEDIADERFDYRKTTAWFDPAKLRPARKEILKRIDDLHNMEKMCSDILRELKALKKLTSDPVRFNQKVRRVHAIRKKMTAHERTYRIINSATQLAELRRYAADRLMSTKGAKGVEKARAQLDRDVPFIEATRDGARDMVVILQEVIRRFDETIARGTRV